MMHECAWPRVPAAALVMLAILSVPGWEALADERRSFGIEVVDAATGRGVPLVTLQTPDRNRFVTDSAGLVAVDDPGLFGTQVYFEVVTTHGYNHPSDGFGFRGRAFTVEPGQVEQIQLERRNIAQRLYRTTGSGIYEHAVRLDRQTPIDKPLLNGQVAGSDSVLAAIYRGQIHWFWGDTSRMSYPLGNFHTTAATSPLPAEDGLHPDEGIDFDYYLRDDGFVRPVAEMPGDGPTWMGSPTVFVNEDGEERLYAIYTKIRNGLEAYQWGLSRWNDQKGIFDHVTTFEIAPPSHSQGHTFRHADANGNAYIYFANPLAMTRVRDDVAAFSDPRQWEHYTPLVQDTSVADEQLDRDTDGNLVYRWKQGTPPLNQGDQDRLIDAGLMQPDEALIRLRDVETGRTVRAHTGSTYWNEYRQKWIMIFVEIGGENSHLGEVWYAEADEPQGPWNHARQILTHDRYDFYNPKHHPFFDQDGGRVIYFEGTYTNTFSGNPSATPRYEYNQVMYKLELDDPRLNLPAIDGQ
ncbi:MAG: hypothetical protein WD294_06450 [Phycisphaeraceae bacterium]